MVGLQLTVTENFSPRINTNWPEYREKISEIRAIRGKFGPVTTNHGLMQSYLCTLGVWIIFGFYLHRLNSNHCGK